MAYDRIMALLVSILRTCLRAAVSLILFCCALEIGLRLFSEMPVQSSEWRLHADWMSLNKDLIQIHERFLRDDFYAMSPDAEAVIVALGDSFTEGACVWENPDAMYPAVLERLLSERGFRANVLNAGITDSGPDQELRLFKQYILRKAKPDIVVWQFYQNDLYDNIIHAVYTHSDSDTLVPLNAAENWTYVRQRLHDGFPLPEQIKRGSYAFQHFLRLTELTRNNAVPHEYKGDPEKWSARKVALAVREMNELARRHDFQAYYVLVVPQSRYLSEEADHQAQAHQVLYDVLSEQARFINMEVTAHAVDAHGASTSSADRRGVAEVVFCDSTRDGNDVGDRHFNELGHLILAETVAERVLASVNGILEQRAFTRPTMAAIPNPVPAGPSWGVTTLTWDAGNVQQAEVYVSMNGEPEQLFSQRTRGYQLVEWIGSDAIYDFRLYAGADRIAHSSPRRASRGSGPHPHSTTSVRHRHRRASRSSSRHPIPCRLETAGARR